MKVKMMFLMKRLAFISYLSSGVVSAEESVEDFFAMTPAQLAATTVTIATGTPTPVFQSAASTSVVTAEQIKSMGATELHEVLETIPGVHASLQPNSYDYNYSIRGIANSANSQVLILLNGTRITTPFSGTLMSGLEMPLEAIQRVEVIRGPGSALYGADAFAGVINIITKTAKDINGSVLGVRAGDHGTQSGWGQQSAEWAGWDISTTLQYQRTDGDQGRIMNADVQTGFDNAFGTHASLAPGPMNTNYETYNGHLNLQRKHWDIGFWAFNANGGVRAGAAGALDPNGNANGQQFLGDVRFSTEDWLDNWELTAHASYLNADFQAQTQLYPDNSLFPIGSNGNISLDNSVLVGFPNGFNTNLGRIEKIPSLELGSIYKGLDMHILRFGTAFRYEELISNQSSNFGYGTQSGVGGALINVTGTPFSYLPDAHRTIGSLVAQDEWQFTTDWQLTTGLRYDHYSDFGGTFNPRVALVWDINKQLTSKLMYGKAFRAPNFREQFTQNNPVVQGNPNLKPETINTYEWALNYRPISSLSTSANVYYYQINNLIAQVTNSGVVASNYQNSGNQNGYGTEFEANWQWSEQWNIKGNYAWQHAINETINTNVVGVPAQHVYVALDWKFLPQWQLQPQLNWIGSRAGNTNQQLSDYETIDFTLRGKKLFGHLNLAASLRNALDTQYYEPTVLSLPTTLPMQGRSFYLEASVNFDAL
ncbi:TonB-dependent siderophore receptor [Methylobacter sp. S3L5C]|uniref:TonB-dependent receptor plug domain-containing protein n=1 Tax=Methylobacter sp. S3L5C TaxID=2839024 RepID=UPI001FAC299D|nr:TonB-dependent receptor [Methylobacter sp. S3L5C]UOA09070.1 TonB-dependent receptor [Methylobacter sp. S3L5C]